MKTDLKNDLKEFLELISNMDNWQIWRDDTDGEYPIGVTEWLGESLDIYDWDDFTLYKKAKILLERLNKDEIL